MAIQKKQKYKEGAIIKIDLEKIRKIGFGRLFNGFVIGVYNYTLNNDKPIPTIEKLTNNEFIFYETVYKKVIEKGDFEIIGYQQLTESEIESVPPKFTQDKVNINDCIIYYTADRLPQKKVTPEECIGLEISSVSDSIHLVRRMEDYFSGKKNPSVELNKVILSTDDIRYLPPPMTLKWDYDKQEYYRTDL